MESLLRFVIYSILCSSVLSQNCPAGWRAYGDRCFQAFEEYNVVTWYDAQQLCENRGGSLATIDSLDLNTYIYAHLNLINNQYWFGLHDIGTEGVFVWSDGTPYDPSQANWASGEPNDFNSNEDCCEMTGYDGYWNDRDCNDVIVYGYICQIYSVSTSRCDEDNGWSSVDGKCYKYISDTKTWTDAHSYCQLMDAELVTVESQPVQDFVDSISRTRLRNLWIGASDRVSGTTGSFTWTDGSALSFTNWRSGEPQTSYSSNCAEVVYGYGGEWNTQDCGISQGFICGKDEGSCPSGWMIYKGSCYQFNSFSSSTWTDAKHTCDAQGAYMMTVNNQEENDFLVSQFENLRSAGVQNIWIGLSDIVNDGNLQWADGSEGPIVYTNWDSSQPKETPLIDDCGSIYVGNDNGLWVLSNCYVLQAFVCEIKVGQTVIPLDPTVEIGSCKDGWFLHGDYCYLFETSQVTFTDAEDACERYGGVLTSIADSDEQSFLSGRIDNAKALMWIGLHDMGSESNWEWVDGTTFGFQNWAPGEPSNSGNVEDCVHLEYEQSKIGEWNDRTCTHYLGFICKAPKNNDGTIVTDAPRPTPAADPRCGTGYEIDSTTNTCYRFAANDIVDWSTAEQTCVKSGGHLLSISGITEQTFINARMYGMTSSVFWVGANDRTDEGGWQWSDGTPYAFVNWNSGEPNDYNHGSTGEDCVEIIVNSGLWNDHRCDQLIGYICENHGEIVENYNVFRGYVLDGFDTMHIDGITAVDCAKRCLEETSFTCNSFDYDKINMACELSSYTKDSAATSLTRNSDYDHYQVVMYKQPDLITTLAPNSRCEYGWYSYGSHCYFAQSVEMSWLDARDTCRKDGADLISIRDANENQFVLSLMQKMCDSFHTDSTDDEYDYRFVLSPISNNRVTFEVRTSSDAHIALSPISNTTNPMYEIVIGGWVNQQSVIRRCMQCANEVVASTIDFLSATEFRAFWVTYSGGTIAVGKDGEPAFMEWTDPNPLTVNYFGYSTGFGHSGDFILCTEHTEDMLVWLGMNDLRTEFTYEWSDMTEVTYTKWNNGEPNSNGDEDCVDMYVSGGLAGYWNDDGCSKAFRSVCKKKKQVLPASTQSTGDCGSGWYAQHHSCYRFVSEGAAWSTAEAQCNAQGGSLVAINDNVEQAYISSKLGTLASGGWYWIGLDDFTSPGQFAWSDGDPVTYTNWDNAQPDNSAGDCVGASTGAVAGLWSAADCTGAMPYICEKTRPGFTKPPVEIPYPTNPSDEGCAGGWLGYGSNCFLAMSMGEGDNRLTWEEALMDCRQRGGDLASFHSEDELRYVKTNSRVINFVDEFWIGLTDRDEENGFTWSDGTPVNFVSWDDGEPNNHNDKEDCVEMAFAAPRGWNDQKCTKNRNWVCKIPKGVPPSSTRPAPTATKSSSCGSDLDWMFALGSCYFFSGGTDRDRRGWNEARDYCLSHGADLASIHSGLEQEFIFNTLRDKRTYSGWIGLREYFAGGVYSWSDNTPLDYVYWDEQQPDDFYGSEQCVEVRGTDGEWNDINCGDRYPFVCKKLTTDTQPKTAEPTMLPTGNCPPGFMEHSNRCYSFNGGSDVTSLSWNDASAECQSRGGDLASIHSQEIQSFMTSQLRDIDYTMWIGLSDQITPGKFRWQDGSVVDYTNWASGEPNGKLQENCAEMHFGSIHGQWNDADCEGTRGYVCQAYKDPSYPAPTQSMNPCKAGYQSYWNGCYKMLSGSYTWQAARELCTMDDADLVSIEDLYEQSYIETYMLKMKAPIWIGLNDVEQGGTYRWSDSSPVLYTKWSDGEPSKDSGEGCVRMGIDGGWDDSRCSLQTGAVCKYYIGNKPTTPAPVDGSCYFGNGSNWSEYHKYCYNFDGLKQRAGSWSAAAYECDKMGGYLVTIDDEDENSYIYKKISDSYMNIWLGLTRNELGGFEWVDNTPLDYTNWAPGEPNNADDIEGCGEMYYRSNEWNDVDCFSSAGFICKRQKGSSYTTLPMEGQPGEQSGGMNGGAITGIILGVVLAVLAAVVVIYLMMFGISLPFGKSKSENDTATGFDNMTYASSPTVVVDDTVKLEFNDTTAEAASATTEAAAADA
ncbi:macrophage mannose receptor 1-like [Ptychodera flava]|uniref:macrophage mannose receptor 1-like n=1 Tax=Ptychodera flava TaxID=63121 RepID=UPI00396A5BA7